MSTVPTNVSSHQQNHPQIDHQPPTPVAGNYQAQNIQQRYYDQYENYARPNPNNTQQNYTNNNHQQMTSHGSNNGYNNGQTATQQLQQTQHQYHNNSTANAQQQMYHNTPQNYAQQPYYPGNAGGAYPTGNGYSHHLESNLVGGGQKITDYDPLNDGSRNAHRSHTNERSGGKIFQMPFFLPVRNDEIAITFKIYT